MNISVFSSDAYYTGLRIMLTTFLNNNNFEKHNIFVISEDISEKKINKLNKYLGKKYGQKVSVLRITEEMKTGYQNVGRFSAAGYHKLYAFRYLPKKIDRILCLDTDVIVMKSIKEFYYQDMDGATIVAMKDISEWDSRVKVEKERLGFGKSDVYYNAGILLIDLEKYLAAYTDEDYKKWISEQNEVLKYAAQDVINVKFRNKIKQNDFEKYDYQLLECDKVSLSTWEEIKKTTYMIHAEGALKPWNFRASDRMAQYVRGVMKKNGMVMEYCRTSFLHFLFLLKYKVIGAFRGND